MMEQEEVDDPEVVSLKSEDSKVFEGMVVQEDNEESEDDNEEYETVVLKNVSIENQDLSKAIVIGSYSHGDNLDGNLQINSEENVVETYILRNADFDSTESLDSEEVEGYLVETENSNDNDGTVVEEYFGAVQESDSDSDDPDFEIVPTRKVAKDKKKLSNFKVEVDVKPLEFPCNKCDRFFKTAVGLKRHKSIAHVQKDATEDDDPLTLQICPCCGEPLDSNTHTVGDYQCGECDKLFPQQSVLDRHTRLEHPNGSDYRCSECRFTCLEKTVFINHLKTHSFKLVQCVCKREFTRKYHLERHLQMSGCGGEKAEPGFACELCNKTFYRRDNLKSHMRSLHRDKREKSIFKCKYCMKAFQTMALLTIHERTHTGEKPFPCTVCPKRFPSSAALKKHSRMHTGEKPYKCPFCDNRFAAKETLNRHVRIHTGEKPHSCQFCGKSFIQAAQLRAHIFHHTGENAYVCRYCNRAFNRKLRLTTHIKYMHEGAEPLHCDKCEKTFFRKEDLARHSISHSGEKPFVCEVCSKAFAVKSSLKIHKLTHNKEPPCSCEYCGRAFIRQDCLMRHMRARHRAILEDIMITAEKKRLQEQLLSAISEAAENGQKSIVDSVIWNEFTLTESIKELLTLLVDEECLTELGYPDTPTDKVLDAVIKRCGHSPASEEDFDYIGRMRENAKLLFTVVIDDEAVKSLLNNQTVDEVILHVLRLAKNNS